MDALKWMEICNNLKIRLKIHKYSLQIYQHYLLKFTAQKMKFFIKDFFIFCAVIFTRTLVLCAVILRTSSTLTKENSKWDLVFRFLTAKALGCLSCSSTDFKIGFAVSSAKEFVLLYSGIFKFFTTFEKDESVPQLLWCIG